PRQLGGNRAHPARDRAGSKSYPSAAARRLRSAARRRFHRASPGVYRSTASYQTASDANLPRLSARLLQQLFRVDDRAGGDRFAAEHARDLGDAFVVLVEAADARTRVAGGVFFPDVEMRRAEAGDLRQGRDADDLIAGCELLQIAADHFRNA